MKYNGYKQGNKFVHSIPNEKEIKDAILNEKDHESLYIQDIIDKLHLEKIIKEIIKKQNVLTVSQWENNVEKKEN